MVLLSRWPAIRLLRIHVQSLTKQEWLNRQREFKLLQTMDHVTALTLDRSLFFMDFFIYERASNSYLGDSITRQDGKVLKVYDISESDPTYKVLTSQMTSHFKIVRAAVTEKKKWFCGLSL